MSNDQHLPDENIYRLQHRLERALGDTGHSLQFLMEQQSKLEAQIAAINANHAALTTQINTLTESVNQIKKRIWEDNGTLSIQSKLNTANDDIANIKANLGKLDGEKMQKSTNRAVFLSAIFASVIGAGATLGAQWISSNSNTPKKESLEHRDFVAKCPKTRDYIQSTNRSA